MTRNPNTSVRTRVRVADNPADEAPEICTPLQINLKPIHEVHGANRALRRRKTAQIERHAACIERHRYDPPIVIDETGRVRHGEDHLASYRHLGRKVVPTITLRSHSEAELEAISLWLDGFDESGEWDEAALKESFEFILANEPDLISHTFWDLGDIDRIFHTLEPKVPEFSKVEDPQPAVVTRTGDVWVWPQGHRLICGDSREPENYARLMAGRNAQILELQQRWHADLTIIEETELGRALVQELRASQTLRPILQPCSEGKEARLLAQSARFETGQVLLPRDAPWLGDYMNELLAFPRGGHDDQVDSTSQALRYLTSRRRALHRARAAAASAVAGRRAEAQGRLPETPALARRQPLEGFGEAGRQVQAIHQIVIAARKVRARRDVLGFFQRGAQQAENLGSRPQELLS
jgi:predicted phage terminase large subunit-like protein